jgi:hypothetical protein
MTKKFQVNFIENLKKDDSLASTKAISFSELGDFQEERDKIRRLLEKRLNTSIKVDYSNFANHVFFDSAVEKFTAGTKRVFSYPYNGSSEDKDIYELSSSGYENHLLKNEWPRYVGYFVFPSGSNQYISASDTDSKLFVGSSSLYVSTWLKPSVTYQNAVLNAVSSSISDNKKFGYELILSGATDPHIKFTMYSGSDVARVSASYIPFTSTFHNVAAIFDKPAGLLSLYVDRTLKSSASVTFGPLEFNNLSFFVGSGSSFSGTYDFYSGSIDEVRVMHTASELYHFKNYNRTITSEDFVRLRYSFNEGKTNLNSVDAVIVDYSKSGIHGRTVNYNSTYARVSGSALHQESGEPILYSFHPSVLEFTASITQSASYYDDNNPNLIFNYIPPDVLKYDSDHSGLMYFFSLGLARYFDDIKTYIDQFENIKTTNYKNINETPDLFLPYLKKYFGWKATEHFNEANPLEFFFGEGILPSGSLETSLHDIRNEFWKRILNNLPYLYSTKGKRHSVDSLFNILGLNRENINLKEYGYLAGGSLIEERIHKEKAVSVLGITGSLSSSYVRVPALITSALDKYTVEGLVQLPWNSSSFTCSLTRGSIWQLGNNTEGFSLLWDRDNLTSTTGKFTLTGSDGQVLQTPSIEIFDGDFIYLASGRNINNKAFIEVRTIDNDVVDFSGSYESALAFSGVFTGSTYDLVIGANSGSIQHNFTKGYFSEFRVWNRQLSSSEINTHALHFENVGLSDPLETPHPLVGHWPLNDNLSSSIDGIIVPINDYSRLGKIATGSDFAPSNSPFKKFLLEYNYISPSVDLKWNENKIRIRNTTELKPYDIATDTNEVALEFNFVDALNEDIMKIFSSFEIINNVVGNPINKYRASYDELEGVRKKYFERLGDGLNFNNFFKLFRWFDSKISDTIKQLLPTRVKFIGGEFVVESHFLERPKYQYQFPVFKTPVDIPEIVFSGTNLLEGSSTTTLEMNAFTSNTEDISNKQVKVSSTQKDAVSVKIECPASIVIFDGELMKS